jgi:putative salt-induced outer membrane protein YdiY
MSSAHIRLLTLLLPLLFVVSAWADEIIVKGDTLHGTVTKVTPETVEIETVYGKGKITIAVEDIQKMTTDDVHHVFHGDEETVGRLVGIERGALLVGDTPADAERVELASIDSTLPDPTVQKSFLGKMKRNLRYWNGGLDLGFSATQSTVDTMDVGGGFRVERKKSPTRLLFLGNWAYGTQKRRDEDKTTLSDTFFGLARGEYDFTPRFFSYGQADGEYDGIERLSFRGVPQAGLGYRVYKTKTSFVALTGGGGYVYERYFGGDTNDYFTLVFGGETEIALPYASVFRANVGYLPSVSDWTNDYLLRSGASLTVPVWEWVAMKAAITDDYDSTPAPDTQRNSFTTLVGLSLLF